MFSIGCGLQEKMGAGPRCQSQPGSVMSGKYTRASLTSHISFNGWKFKINIAITMGLFSQITNSGVIRGASGSAMI